MNKYVTKPEFLETIDQKILGNPPYAFDFRVEKHKLQNGPC